MKHVEGKYIRGRWVCIHCKKPPQTIYVVTGHDHTDSSFWVCDCGGGSSIEAEWNQNPFAGACPEEYRDKES